MDMKAVIEALGITREDVLERASELFLRDGAEDFDVQQLAENLISNQVRQSVSAKLNAIIERTLTAEMEKILSHEYLPVDMWGEPTGKATTIRDQLAARARKFWDENVDKNGKPAGYGGQPRHQYVYAMIVGDEFKKAIAQDYTNVVGALKDALKASAEKELHEHLDNIIRVRTKADKR